MEFLSFFGEQNDDVTTFLQAVKRIALTEGKSRDDDWLTDYVESCLTGPALDWYAQLDKNVQTSWQDLRLALLQKYTARGNVGPPAAPPAQAPPAVPSGQVL